MRLRPRGGWSAYLVVGVLLAAVHIALPEAGLASALSFPAIAASGAIAVAVGMRRRSYRSPWLLMLVGMSLMAAGDVVWGWYEFVAQIDPFPSLADALYLPGYPCVAAGLLLLVQRRGNGRDGMVDALIIATGTGVVSWVFLISPYVKNPALTVLERAISVAYPVMGVLLVAVVARLLLARSEVRCGELLIGAGLGCLLIADTYLAVIELTSGYNWNAVPEFLWLAMYVLVGAAALTPEPSMEQPLTDVAYFAGEPTMARRLRLPVLALASLTAPAVLAGYARVHGDADLAVIAAGAGLLAVLVLTRMMGLVHRGEEQAAHIHALASHDPLTGLPNRRRWEFELPRMCELSSRGSSLLCVAMIDLDHFKAYNDTFGHPAGDHLLRECGHLWQSEVRTSDLLARLGGEEFGLALPYCSIDTAEQAVARMRDLMPANQSFSCGIAQWDGNETDLGLLNRADRALYAAKAAGRACTVRAEPTHVAAHS